MNSAIHDLAQATQKYNVILADPPWRYEDATPNRKIENHYVTMSTEDICNMDIPTAADSILFMWTTSPKLEEGFQVLNAWGFSYRSSAVWDKKVIGMGYYFRQQHELLLVGKKGKFPTPPPHTRISSIIHSKRQKHSQKPAVIYEIIEAMYPDGKYLELFARNRRYGWDCFGNEMSTTHQALLSQPISYGVKA